MKYFVGALIATAFWIGLLAIVPMPEESIKFYDCGLAEWHPDIPKEVREVCRQRFKQTPSGPIT